MPQSHDLAELWEVARSVQVAIRTHEAECVIRNKNAEEAASRTEQRIEKVDTRVSSLEESRAKLLGYMFGIAAGGSIAGGGIVAGAIKLFGG